MHPNPARLQTRLAASVAFARQHSRFYAEHYHNSPLRLEALRQLPPVTKSQLMTRFDDWLTNSAVTRAGIEAFVADNTQIGQPYFGHYMVFTSSGTTGVPGLFIHDAEALAVYDAIAGLRGWPRWITLADWPSLVAKRGHMAAVVATNGHFAGVVSWERLRQTYPFLTPRLKAFSVLQPLTETVNALNAFQPAVVFGYATALSLLAEEQLSDRLRLRPTFILTSGERLEPSMRANIQLAFKCPVHEIYGASEFPWMAFDCREGWFHLASDWVILEPVDDAYAPVPIGSPSATVLLTNLANHIQPLIRYDLGDSVVLRPDPCPCGNPFPAVRVEGRTDELLSLPTGANTRIRVPPMALITLVEETPGVQRFQIIQTASATLQIHLEVKSGADEQTVWRAVQENLGRYFGTLGVPHIILQRNSQPPQRNPISGKFRQVWAAPEAR